MDAKTNHHNTLQGPGVELVHQGLAFEQSERIFCFLKKFGRLRRRCDTRVLAKLLSNASLHVPTEPPIRSPPTDGISSLANVVLRELTA